ncbi:MAG: DUF58 domain-containing protein [Thiomicrorhabdus sp.]|jgi:uncharacterized protein (DUF58 family)|nr:DUF58 domain-containing protein [Thiomicrorhabdus sp.]
MSPISQTVEQSTSLYSQLEELVAFRFHVKQKKLSQQNNLMASSGGNHHAQRKGRGMTFSEVRQYQPGDDIRHIDWRVTARTQKTHTKVFIEEQERPVILVTEQTPALFFGSQVRLKAAQALNLSAILAWIALNQSERVGGFSFNESHQAWVSPKRSKQTVLHTLQHSLQMQNQLTRPGQSNPLTWQSHLKHLTQVVKPGSKLFLIGDLLQLNEQSMAYIRSLSRHNDVVAIHIFDPLEKQLPKLGWLSLTLGFHSDSLLKLDSFRSQTRDNYAELYAKQWQAAQDQFRQIKLPLIEIGCHENPLESLLRHKVIL